VSDQGQYQAFQHFITSAPWSADGLWRALRRRVPARAGVLIFDGTSFPKQGDRSVGVARQYCGALDKIAIAQWPRPRRSGRARRRGYLARSYTSRRRG
jgi:SRSO17 transposase